MNLLHLSVTTFLGLMFILSIGSLFQKGKLGMRYALGWLFLGFSTLFYLPLLELSNSLANRIDIQPLAIMLGIPLIVIGLVCVQITISISGLPNNVRSLAETIALIQSQKVQQPSIQNSPGNEE